MINIKEILPKWFINCLIKIHALHACLETSWSKTLATRDKPASRGANKSKIMSNPEWRNKQANYLKVLKMKSTLIFYR